MTSGTGENRDFFVSYAHEDNCGRNKDFIANFVKRIVEIHRDFIGSNSQRELTYFFDEEAIKPGHDWEMKIRDNIAHSKMFLAFISPNYLASEYCRKEWRWWMDAEIGKHIFTEGAYPIYIVEVPGLMSGDSNKYASIANELLKLSAQGEKKNEALLKEVPEVLKSLARRQYVKDFVKSFESDGIRALLCEDVSKSLREVVKSIEDQSERIRTAEANDAHSTVPSFNKNFSGRRGELEELRSHLMKDQRTGVIYGVHGMGGIGKTELALAYAHAFASVYSGGRFFIECDGKKNIEDAILNGSGHMLEKLFSYDGAPAKQTYMAVLNCLQIRLDKLGHILLILDNVSDIDFLGSEQAGKLTALGPKIHILVTTRLEPPASVAKNWVAVGLLPDEDALNLLRKHREIAEDDEKEKAAARSIVKKIGGFSLALELVGSWLAVKKDSSSYSTIEDLISLDVIDKYGTEKEVKSERHNHEKCLSAIFAPVLASLNPFEKRTLEYSAFLSPDSIPLDWLKKLVATDLPEILEIKEGIAIWPNTWSKLMNLAIFSNVEKLDKDTRPRMIRVHRLVQEVILKTLSKSEKEYLQNAVQGLIEERMAELHKTKTLLDYRWEVSAIYSLEEVWRSGNHPKLTWLREQFGVLRNRLDELLRAKFSEGFKENYDDARVRGLRVGWGIIIVLSLAGIIAAYLLGYRLGDLKWYNLPMFLLYVQTIWLGLTWAGSAGDELKIWKRWIPSLAFRPPPLGTLLAGMGLVIAVMAISAVWSPLYALIMAVYMGFVDQYFWNTRYVEVAKMAGDAIEDLDADGSLAKEVRDARRKGAFIVADFYAKKTQQPRLNVLRVVSLFNLAVAIAANFFFESAALKFCTYLLLMGTLVLGEALIVPKRQKMAKALKELQPKAFPDLKD